MKIIIISAGNCFNIEKLKKHISKSDYIICADGGYEHLTKIGIKPDLIVGDFDSLKSDINCENIIRLPVEKDDTDTLFALKKAFEKNPDEIIIYGGIGSRFDHSYANMCLAGICAEKNIKAKVTDGFNSIYIIMDKISLKSKKGKTVSIYSFSDKCEGVTLSGFKYPLSDFTLLKENIIGTSNIIISEEAEIRIKSGKLIVICNENEII